METWREVRENISNQIKCGSGIVSLPPLIWEKLIEMEERVEKLEEKLVIDASSKGVRNIT